MKGLIYKLKFSDGIHIGSGSLSSSDITVHADTLFSAICIEALNTGGEDMLMLVVEAAKNDKLLLSDALPYIDDTLYFPKPICRLENNKQQDNDLKKEFKNLKYIPYDELDTYMSGNIDPIKTNEKFSMLGKKELHQKVSLKAGEDNELYAVGVYRFAEKCGLYILVYVSDDATEKMFDDIMDSLQFSGIGGKRTSGYGKFTYTKSDFSMSELSSGKYMTITSCMAEDEKLEAVLENATYKLIKRSGFVQSATYAETNVKKHDFYLFDSGSVFDKKFKGDVFDVSIEGNHPVYKYAKPLFVRIGGGV